MAWSMRSESDGGWVRRVDDRMWRQSWAVGASGRNLNGRKQRPLRSLDAANNLIHEVAEVHLGRSQTRDNRDSPSCIRSARPGARNGSLKWHQPDSQRGLAGTSYSCPARLTGCGLTVDTLRIVNVKSRQGMWKSHYSPLTSLSSSSASHASFDPTRLHEGGGSMNPNRPSARRSLIES